MDLPNRLSHTQKLILALLAKRRYTHIEWIVRYVAVETDESRYTPTVVGVQVDDSNQVSVSRSLRRLEQRNLLLRLSRARTTDMAQTGLPVDAIPERTSTSIVIPSLRGRQVGHELYQRAKDGRYNLSFSSL